MLSFLLAVHASVTRGGRVRYEVDSWGGGEGSALEVAGGGQALLAVPSAGKDVACADLPMSPKPRCMGGAGKERGGWKRHRVCPGAPDVQRLYDPDTEGAARNFGCEGATPLCCTDPHTSPPIQDSDPVVGDAAADAAANYAKYQADLARYNEVYPPMSDCEGMTKTECLAGENKAFLESAEHCEEMEEAQSTKCVLAAMQNRISSSGLHYTYDNGETPNEMGYKWTPWDELIGDDVRSTPQETAEELYKDPMAIMKDGQGDCDDVAIMQQMWCQEAIAKGALSGECMIVRGNVPGGGHAITVFKDESTGEAYVLDGTYYQDKDSYSWTNDQSKNPDELIKWNDYISNGDCSTCRGFEVYGTAHAADPSCWTTEVKCVFVKNGDPESWAFLDDVSEGSTIDDSIDASDLKTARWAAKGYSAPLDQWDVMDIQSLPEAAYVAESIQFEDMSMFNATSIAEGVAGAWVSALFAYRQLRKNTEKREHLRAASKLLAKPEGWWTKSWFGPGGSTRKLRRILELFASVFCHDNADMEVDCSDPMRGVKQFETYAIPEEDAVEPDDTMLQLSSALALFHRRDAVFTALPDLCRHVKQRFHALEQSGAWTMEEELPACELFVSREPKCQEKPELPGCEVPQDAEAVDRLKKLASQVGLTWETSRVGWWKRWRSKVELAPFRHQLAPKNSVLMAVLEKHFTGEDLRQMLVKRQRTVKVLESLADYNSYERDHWVAQSVIKAAASTAISVVPLFGATDFMRAHFYTKSETYRKNTLQALRSRTRAAKAIANAPGGACQTSENDKEAAKGLLKVLEEYKGREEENIVYLMKRDSGYASIHTMSGLMTPVFYIFGPLGTLFRALGKGVLKLALSARLGAFKRWREGKPKGAIDVATVFDHVESFQSPTCKRTLAYTLFDLDPRQYEAIVQGDWIRKNIFTPSMSVPSMRYIKLWKTRGWLTGWWHRLRQWTAMRIASPAVGFGVGTSVVCEPEPQCSESGALKGQTFLRVSAWKTDDGPSTEKKPPVASAVRNWNRKNKDAQVNLHDIVLTVNHGPGVKHALLRETGTTKERVKRVVKIIRSPLRTFGVKYQLRGKEVIVGSVSSAANKELHPQDVVLEVDGARVPDDWSGGKPTGALSQKELHGLYDANFQKWVARMGREMGDESRVTVSRVVATPQRGARDRADELQNFDRLDENMKVWLSVLPGFRSFPVQERCVGHVLRVETQALADKADAQPRSGSSSQSSAGSSRGSSSRGSSLGRFFRRLRGKKEAPFNSQKHRQPWCEKLCLADPLCDAVEVQPEMKEHGTCTLMLLDDEVPTPAASAPVASTVAKTAKTKPAHQCWMRTQFQESPRAERFRQEKRRALGQPEPAPRPEFSEDPAPPATQTVLTILRSQYSARSLQKKVVVLSVGDLGGDVAEIDFPESGLVFLRQTAHEDLQDGDLLVKVACDASGEASDVSQATLAAQLGKCGARAELTLLRGSLSRVREPSARDRAADMARREADMLTEALRQREKGAVRVARRQRHMNLERELSGQARNLHGPS